MATFPQNGVYPNLDDNKSQDAAPNTTDNTRIVDGRIEEAFFSPEFLSVDIHYIVNELNERGYYAFPSALSPNTVQNIERDATQTKHGLNVNKVSGVFAGRQYYFPNLLAVSETFYNFLTSSFVFGVCDGYLGKQFRLVALRYYETYGGYHMQWHTDNKTERGFAHIPGIIFIFYVSDVEDGEFQYVEGSHLWSGETGYNSYTEQFIVDNFASSVRSFKMPRGSLIIYNTYGIHRARPVANKRFVRKSVFFQVDSEIQKSEPISESIIVNTEFLSNLNDRTSMLLGFGRPTSERVFPVTSINSRPLDRMMLSVIGNYLFFRLSRAAFAKVPQSLKPAIRKSVGRR